MRNGHSVLAIAALCAALLVPGLAAAQSVAYATEDGYTNLRAGPSTRYQVIARVYPGARVDVLGCLDARDWCDVIVDDIRGWIYAGRLEFVYSGRRLRVPDYYSYFGAPYVIFQFGDHRRRRHDNRGDDGPVTHDVPPHPIDDGGPYLPWSPPHQGGGYNQGQSGASGGSSVGSQDGGSIPPPPVSSDGPSGAASGNCPMSSPDCR